MGLSKHSVQISRCKVTGTLQEGGGEVATLKVKAKQRHAVIVVW